MRVALVHDWLNGMRGGEKVLEAFCELFPDADIYTLIWLKGRVSKKIESHRITVSALQKFPLAENKYRYYLPLMPSIIERFDLSEYDLVISSSHCVAKGVKTGKKTTHVCYCYTPMRYIWDQYTEYFNPERAGIFTRILMSIARPYLQKWDVKSSQGVTHFITLSEHIKRKIAAHYNRDSTVIYPPVDVENYPQNREENYFLIVSALVPYKRVDIAIRAFNELGYNLKIIGTGPDESRLKAMASPNIEFLGWLQDAEIKDYYAGCRAFIFPQEEDFGITAVEAQAAGKPVIAFAKGGALETVIDGRTGIYFNEPTHKSIFEAVKRFEKINFSFEELRKNASRFSTARFKNEILHFIDKIAKISV